MASFFLFEEQQPMPQALLNEDGEPFTECKQCGSSLIEPPKSFSLEKVFKRYANTEQPQVLFEYAICDECTQDIREEFSEESMQRMRQFFEDVAERRRSEEQPDPDDIDARLSMCAVLGTPLIAEKEFAWVARGFGNSMLLGEYPLAVSLTAMDQLSALLSEKTRDALDDFVNRNFSGPPEFSKIPDGGGKWVLV